MQKQRMGLPSIRTVPELVEGKSPMADESFANEVYNMSYAKLAIGHGYYKTHNKFVPILTDGLEASRL